MLNDFAKFLDLWAIYMGLISQNDRQPLFLFSKYGL